MSGEHLWPEWMHPYLPTFYNPHKWEIHEIRRLNRPIRITRKKPQMGTPYARKIRVVCKRCNETWMGDIEQVARPILIPMLQGSPITLRDEEQEKVARWLALKMMVIDQERPAESVLPQEARAEFLKTGAIPDGIKLWVGYHDSEKWYGGYFSRALTASLTPTFPVTGRLKNVQTSAFGVGHIFSLALVTTLREFDLNFDPLGHAVRQIWPRVGRPIVWPPRVALSEVGAGRLANVLRDVMNAPFAVWRPMPQ